MLTAEHSSAVSHKIDPNSYGALPHRIGSFYNESLIINYLNEPLYAIDYNNHPVLIQQHPHPVYGNYRKVEIRSRSHLGQATMRTYDPRTGLETTPTRHEIMQISFESLREQPFFVEELNAVLCFHDQLSITKHPHSKEAVAELVRDIQIEVYKSKADAPFVLLANDPSRNLTKLFIEVNGVICSVRVTHITEEEDSILLAVRDKDHSPESFTRHQSTFTQLLTQDPKIWTLGGFRLSSDREWFEQVLQIERSTKPSTIEVSIVDALLKRAREEDSDRIKLLLDEKKELQRRLTSLSATHDAMLSGDYHEKVAELAQEKLRLEKIKLQQSAVEAKLTMQGEKLKFKKELISTFGVAAKTLAVVVPIGIGIYKVVMAAKAKA
jgi:hypothetical protein